MLAFLYGLFWQALYEAVGRGDLGSGGTLRRDADHVLESL